MEIKVKRYIKIPMHDGIKLVADLYYPKSKKSFRFWYLELHMNEIHRITGILQNTFHPMGSVFCQLM
jgi:hypothetical protein